ncbi:MAG: antA/AntB antirepressor family protein [Methylobacter sp.]
MTEITTPSTIGNLIPVFTAEIGGVATHVVNGRDLHKFLGVKRDFSTWIKKRIADYQFVENKNYSIPRLGELENSGLQTKIEYHLTLTMAKELGLVERNEQGRIVRQYFIDCENQLHAQASAAPPQLPPLSALETGNDSSRLPEIASIVLLIQERSLFLTLLDCGALGAPALSSAELQARWRVSRSYFDKLSEDMYEAMYEAVDPNEGELREKTRAAFQFIRQWRPHPGYSFPELGKRRD